MRWRRLEVGLPYEAGREGDGGGGVLSLMILLGRRWVAAQGRARLPTTPFPGALSGGSPSPRRFVQVVSRSQNVQGHEAEKI
jgi:hypothetical protein